MRKPPRGFDGGPAPSGGTITLRVGRDAATRSRAAGPGPAGDAPAVRQPCAERRKMAKSDWTVIRRQQAVDTTMPVRPTSDPSPIRGPPRAPIAEQRSTLEE